MTSGNRSDVKIQITQATDHLLMTIGSILNEETIFPNAISHSRVVVDFVNLKHVNSFGIKKWCQWINQHKSVRAIFLQNCPYIFTRSFPTVNGMLGANVIVRSLYVPYFSVETSERKDYLFKHGEQYDDHGIKALPIILDSKGVPMVLDVIKDQYFRFIKR